MSSIIESIPSLFWIVILLIAFSAYMVLKVAAKIAAQQKHLDDETLRMVVENRIRHTDRYEQTIGHLGWCRECQARLDEISRE